MQSKQVDVSRKQMKIILKLDQKFEITYKKDILVVAVLVKYLFLYYSQVVFILVQKSTD